MGVYAVSSQYICSGEPYEIKATVVAQNQVSAQPQLDWLVQHASCMCKDCIIKYAIDYHINLTLPSGMPPYNMCIKK